MNKLAIILPCWNEEDVLQLSINILSEYFNNLIEKRIISKDSFLCFVDDGSEDDTWKIVTKNSNRNFNALPP